MRQINRIIIHCTDTLASHDVTASDIDKWHKAKGWSGIGYHFLITRGGDLETGRHIGQIGAHTAGHNQDSIGIALAGGKNGFNYTSGQLECLSFVVGSILFEFGQHITIHGHNEFSNKACPQFDVKEFFKKD